MKSQTPGLTRRTLLTAAAGVGLAGLSPARAADDTDELLALVRGLTGQAPVLSERVRLVMPRAFPKGDSVPLELSVDSAMTDADHVRHVDVLAPKNPIIEVVRLTFAPGRCEARVSTRIRLAEPQHVLAVAAMNDGALLMGSAWVEVATNGCT